MELKQIQILLLFISFHIILNEPIEIKNYERITFLDEITLIYNYNFSHPIAQEEQSTYFFFRFTFINAIIRIIDEDKNEGHISSKNYDSFHSYKIDNRKPQKYTFIATCSYCGPVSFFFIDNSKEINLNIKQFYERDFPAFDIKDKPPLPLIFKLEDSFEDRTIIGIDSNYNVSQIYGGKYKVEYCEINENECNFTHNESRLIFEKDKKYKIKFNCFKENNNTYYFVSYMIMYIIKEGFGYYNCEISSKIKSIYYILNIVNYTEFYIYSHNFYSRHSRAFVTENEKNEFMKNISIFDVFEKEYQLYEGINHIYGKKDYLIICFPYTSFVYNVYVYFFNLFLNLENNSIITMEKGEYALLSKKLSDNYHYYDREKYILISSSYNMKIFDLNLWNETLTNLMVLEDSSDDHNNKIMIYIDSSEEKSIILYYFYEREHFDSIQLNFINPNNLSSLNRYIKTASNLLDYDYKFTFFIYEEKYYLFSKNYFGNINVYKYNYEINNIYDNYSHLIPPEYTDNIYDYEIINNKILIVSKDQLIVSSNSHESLNYLYFEKVNDLEHIQIDSETFIFNNLIKILNENKTYYLDFKVDHLITLDKEFLDAHITFTDMGGQTYVLNKDNKIITNLKGEGITVKTTKLALVYFYKRIEDITDLESIEFDKSQTGKNMMKFNITSNYKIKINIAKDFGFEGFYPMLSKESLIEVNSENYTTTIYVENLYDKLNYELYEGEKYYIYIFSSKMHNLSDPIYFNNLLTPKNKYNFEIIPPNSTGSIILNLIDKQNINYKFYSCNNKQINFKIESSNEYFPNAKYPFEKSIYQNDQIELSLSHKNEILVHSFNSINEFLFIYNFNDYSYCNKLYFRYSIQSIIEIRKNILQIKFTPEYENCLSQYYVIIGKKNDINNIESFSDECYLSKILLQNSTDSIVFELIYQRNEIDPIETYVDISKLNVEENSELIVNIISYNSFNIYKPEEFKLPKKDFKEFKICEDVIFNLKDNQYFKFEYKDETTLPQELYFYFDPIYDFNFFFSDNSNTTIYEIDDDLEELVKVILTKSGTYYIEFQPTEIIYTSLDDHFIAFIPGSIIDIIDLTENIYYGNSKVKTRLILEPNKYKVKNIKNDTLIYFSYKIQKDDDDDDDESIYFNNPFEICNNNNNICTKNVTFFKFIKGNEYTIYIHYIKNMRYSWDEFYYPSYKFFPVFEEQLEVKEEGFYFILEPKIYIVNLKNKDFLYLLYYNANKVYMSYTNEENIFNNINNLIIIESTSNLELISGKKGFNYVILVIIPLENNNRYNSVKLIIANQLINNINQEEYIEYNILAGNNAIINFKDSIEKYNMQTKNKIPKKIAKYEDNEEEEEEEEEVEEDDDDKYIFYNIITTFSSEEKNMRYIKKDDSSETYDFIVQNSSPFPIYIDKLNKDVIIKIKTYNPRYSYFYAINNYIFKNTIENLPYMVPLYIRLNTDNNKFYDFINFYLYDKNINIYIKKIYGETDIYECNADSIDRNDLSILTKPISSCENKKSILNKFYNLNGTKIITGYLGSNSYFDISLDLNDNYKIEIPLLISSFFNCISKYLKAGIEYSIDFRADHLVKLDPDFNAEVSIYDDDFNIILNSENPIAKIKGRYLKIKSNNNTMVYFYGKLSTQWGFKQKRIDIEKRKNIEIKIKYYTLIILDFGFEGYNPADYSIILDVDKYFRREGTLFIENIYDKLKTKLVKEESLYLYYIGYDNSFEIDYKENINNANNEYTFYVIPKNSENKTLIINNINMNQIKYQVNFCNSAHTLKMFYQSGYSLKEKIFEFNGNKTTIERKIYKKPFKLRFESKEDFVFSYSFIDSRDKYFNKKIQWNEEREVFTNLNIEEINIKNNSNIISIRFNPNYKASSTRYIVVIAPKNLYNTKKTLSNPCYITKLVTEKIDGIKIINIADTGENGLINVDIDISDLSIINNKFIIGIISQELRFEKKLNYYNPYEFSLIQESSKDIDIEEESQFNLNDIVYYDLPYIKNSQMNEMLILNYKLDEVISMIIHIYSPNNKKKSIKINNKEGNINFLCEESGFYRIFFEKIENNILKSTNSTGIGTFKILSTEYPFKIDITKDNIEYNEFNITREEPPSLNLIIEPLKKDYIKKININNMDFNEINKIVSISKNNEEFKTLNFFYYTFEKGINYNIIINFNKKGENIFRLEKINIIDFSPDNIQHFSKGFIKYNDTNDRFIILNWTNYDNILITIINNEAKLLKSEITEEQTNNLVKEFQELNFTRLNYSKTYNIGKPFEFNYSVILIELYQKGTEIKFEIIENNNKEDNKDDNKDENKGLSIIYIFLISIFSLILIIIILFFVLRHFKRKVIVDLSKQTETLENETLMSEI